MNETPPPTPDPHESAPPPPAALPQLPTTPPPAAPVQIVNFPKLWGTLVLAILSAVAIIMGLSQATGYNLYTGDELESHRAERVLEELDDTGSGEIDTGGGDFSSRDACMADPETTYEECLELP